MKRQYILALVLLLNVFQLLIAQGNRGMTMNNDYTSLYFLNPNRNNGYEISVSAVAMFTMGVADRSGMRWGGGVTLAKRIGDFRISLGLDAYKAQEKFGVGTTFAGVEYDDSRYGGSYYVNKYSQGEKQVSGIVGLRLREFQIRFEDDILSLPFTKFVVFDRYRTAALEVRYKHFLAGFNVFTNEPNGLMDVSADNKYGTYYTGQQISSPIYVGYTNKNLVARYGLNSNIGGMWGQNNWHRYLFNSPDYKTGGFNNMFLQFGVDKPYTLY